MLSKIIPHINLKIDGLETFEKMYELCDIIIKDGKSFPAAYCNNEYTQIEFDKYKGVVYHRLDGAASFEEREDASITVRDAYYERSYPLKIVAGIYKKHLKGLGDDAYLPEKMANNIARAIAETNSKALRTELFADSATISINDFVTDINQLFSEEYSGLENFIRYEFLYIAINYTVTVSGIMSCFENNDC